MARKQDDDARLEEWERIARNPDRYKPKGKVYVVLPRRTIHWPDGTVRGTAGYAVLADDPTVAHYFRNGEPAMMVADDDATPDPPTNWPPRWRKLAGGDFRTASDRADDAQAARSEVKKAEGKAKLEAEKSESRETVASEVSGPDEPLNPTAKTDKD